ncbi:MAG: hypothetical protein Q9174_002482 [Haloplaca sp. 1 TL-2023]
MLDFIQPSLQYLSLSSWSSKHVREVADLYVRLKSILARPSTLIKSPLCIHFQSIGYQHGASERATITTAINKLVTFHDYPLPPSCPRARKSKRSVTVFQVFDGGTNQGLVTAKHLDTTMAEPQIEPLDDPHEKEKEREQMLFMERAPKAALASILSSWLFYGYSLKCLLDAQNGGLSGTALVVAWISFLVQIGIARQLLRIKFSWISVGLTRR